MAKNAANSGLPHDVPAMDIPGELVNNEMAFFADPAANGYAKGGFFGDSPRGAAKGNRNSNSFPAQARDPSPFGKLRRK